MDPCWNAWEHPPLANPQTCAAVGQPSEPPSPRTLQYSARMGPLTGNAPAVDWYIDPFWNP